MNIWAIRGIETTGAIREQCLASGPLKLNQTEIKRVIFDLKADVKSYEIGKCRVTDRNLGLLSDRAR